MNENVRKAIEDLGHGKFVLVYDIDGKEEEVDLICLAEKVTAKHIYSMRHDAGGLICVALHGKIARKLGLPFMAEIFSKTTEYYDILKKISPDLAAPYGDKPSFSITVNHIETYTGITDNDRALTINELGILGNKVYRNGGNIKLLQDSFSSSFRAPGHTHLLIGNEDLVEGRLGHTELSLTLAHIGDLSPISVVCEMLDGTTGNALTIAKAQDYAKKNHLVMINGDEIVEAYKEFSKVCVIDKN